MNHDSGGKAGAAENGAVPVEPETAGEAADGDQGGGGRRRNRWRDRDLTNGSIPKNLWSMAWPQSVESSLRVVQQVLDLIWAGFLGVPHLAGVGVAQQYTQMVWTARQGVDTAQRAMIARAIGMGNIDLARRTVFQGVTVTAVFWFLIAALGVIFTEPLLRLLGVSEAVVEVATPYMRVQFVGQGFMSFQQLLSQALVASGDPMTPMRAHLVSRVVHVLLAPVLVFGLLGMPGMGIAGAPVAAAAGNALALVIVCRVLFSDRSRLHLRFSDYRLDWDLMKQLLRIGIPAAVNGAERSVAQLIVVVFVTPFGDSALAAYTLTRRFQMFSNLGSQGFGRASGVIIGQCIGAGKPERAKETIYWALGYVMLVKAVLVAVLFIFPQVFLSIFTRDPELLALASTWLRIQCIGYFAMGFNQVLQQSFMTAGATVWPMFVTLFALWGVELPLAYLFSGPLDLGQMGIAWALTLAMLVRPLLQVPYLFSGRWLRVAVFSEKTLGGGRRKAEAVETAS